jgi:ABC-type transport system involved in multi-copper enzyme maturation permease subunit
MTWLTWRQYRAQAAIAAALLAAFAAVLVVTGLQMASQWHSALVTCTASRTCGNLAQNLYLGSPAAQILITLTIGVPAVLGLLWGAPLAGHEIETGTSTFVWTQSVTRSHWFTVKAGWLLLAVAAWGGAVTGLVTWWSGPKNALYGRAFQPGFFDLQGIVPVGYALFATALGIAAGTLLRRTLPAIAIVLGGFVGLRLVFTEFIRQHYITAVTAYYSPLAEFTPSGSFWVLSQGFVNKQGQAFTGQSVGSVLVNGVPLCQAPLARGVGPGPTKLNFRAVLSCMQVHGFRGFTTYQPASRYWAFQGIETGIFVALAAALLALAFIVVRRRDA